MEALHTSYLQDLHSPDVLFLTPLSSSTVVVKLVLQRSPTTLLTARLPQKTCYGTVENSAVASHAAAAIASTVASAIADMIASRTADAIANTAVEERPSLVSLPGLHCPSNVGLSGQEVADLIRE